MAKVAPPPAAARGARPKVDFTTVSSRPVAPLYTPSDVSGLDYAGDLADPGQYPYTRGIHASMYRGKLWTMRQFAGFGTPEDTNARFRYLLEQGEDGLSVAFDLPTLMGRDSDDPHSEGEVGKCGVAVDSLRDMETLFRDIPLGEISTSMTINGPAVMLLAMYIAVAEEQGASRHELRGTVQADILKEYIAQKEWLFPPRPSMRVMTDLIVFSTREMPRYNSVSVSGYHIREAGSTAAQELAFTLADGLAYVEAGVAAGLDVDEFAPRLSFFFNCHIDFFEEIAKLRAARRVWARVIRERFGAKDERSWKLRFHTQTAGCSLTAQQPYNNVVRTAVEALAAVLGGTQSLHTNSLDEVLALPSEWAARLALRTQQVIAYESGVVNTADPLGGSYFVEKLTSEMEADCWGYFEKIEALGGVIPAIEQGFFQREMADAAYVYQRELEERRRVVVGVNAFTEEASADPPLELLRIGAEAGQTQERKLAQLRRERDGAACQAALARLQEVARGDGNLLPPLIEAAKAYCTLGEMREALQQVLGTYQEEPVF
jgi:methylmalonyl-CoA mutase N-terminal domain/subunit